MRAHGVGRPREMRLMRTGRRVVVALETLFEVEGGSCVKPVGIVRVEATEASADLSDTVFSDIFSCNTRQSHAQPSPTSPFFPFPRSTASQLVLFALGRLSQSAFLFLLSSTSQPQPAFVPG